MARINRAIELLEQGQPIYYTGTDERTFEGGARAAATFAGLSGMLRVWNFSISRTEPRRWLPGNAL